MYSADFFKNAQSKIHYETADGQMLSEHVCAFTGHRSQKLGFESESSEECLLLKSKIHATIKLAMSEGYRAFITGMASGVDTWAAEEVLLLKTRFPEIKLYAAVPYKKQYEKLYNWQKERYFRILSRCERVFLISEEYNKACLHQRNAFMIENADLLISVYDGSKGGTSNTVALAKKKGIDIYNINPSENPLFDLR